MAVFRDHPYERSYFQVDIGDGSDPLPFELVELPVATTDIVATRSGSDRRLETNLRPGLVSYTNLVLTRGLRGRTELVEWWERVRTGDDEVGRNVTVELLDEQRQRVWSWRFEGAFPAAYYFSPLDASSSEAVDEILELAFTSMSIDPK